MITTATATQFWWWDSWSSYPWESLFTSAWPYFNPSMIYQFKESSSVDPRSPILAKALLPDRSSTFFKSMCPGDERSLLRKFNTYNKIRNAHLDKSLRISRLIASHEMETAGRCSLLLTDIDCGNTTLSRAIDAETNTSSQRKWIKHKNTIAQLHHAEIIWSDVKQTIFSSII